MKFLIQTPSLTRLLILKQLKRILAPGIIALGIFYASTSQAQAQLEWTLKGRRTEFGRELFAAIALSIPLGAFIEPSLSSAAGEGFQTPPDPLFVEALSREQEGASLRLQAGLGGEYLGVASRGSRETPAPERPAEGDGAGAQISDEEMQLALPEALELSTALVQRLVRRALQVDGVKRRRGELSKLASRAKSSAWLPQLGLRGGRRSDQSLRLTPTSADPYRYSQTDGSDLYGEARLAWSLDRLVFSKDEVALNRLRAAEDARRDQIIERLLKSLFEWQLAELRAIDPGLAPEERLRFKLAAAQARLRCDVLTGGSFSRWVR